MVQRDELDGSREMKKSLIFAGIFLMGIEVGAQLSAFATGDLMPVRIDGKCGVLDPGVPGGAIVGMTTLSDRCHLRDWRIRHPFGG
jgi:hypothetical protein